MACGILVPWQGIEPAPPTVEARSPNHWTAREVPPLLIKPAINQSGAAASLFILSLPSKYRGQFQITPWRLQRSLQPNRNT